MNGISKFKMALHAIEEASTRAERYHERYAVIEFEGDFGVCSFENLEPYDQIIEICTPTKSKLTVENESFKAPEAVRVRDFED